MAELKASLQPYCLESVLDTDSTDNNCFVLDVGRDELGCPLASLKHVASKVDDYVLNVHDLLAPTAKLYLIGDWNLAPPKEEPVETETEPSDEQARYENEPHNHTKPEQEWHEAGEAIAKLVQQMPALKELTWISSLPFMSCIWETLSTSLTKLVLDLGQPVRLQQDRDIEYKSYITPIEMKPLQQQAELQELRLLNMHDSYQSIVWETVFHNTSDSGMRVLDLQMAAAPLVRSEHWRKASDVFGLTVSTENTKEKEYKGIEGKGVLHYSFGTGEYLDDFCMRKARIASGLEEARPLPLWCLKLDGFVVDHLPFKRELSRMVLLTCGEKCIDSGLRAPTSGRAPHNRWSKIINNATSHCLIQWPNWTGIFDHHGDQRDTRGDVVPQELGLSTPASDFPPPSPMPLTKETLQVKELNDALDGVVKQDMGTLSNLSTRGSEVPTSTCPMDSDLGASLKIIAVDGPAASDVDSPVEDSLSLVHSFSTVATDSSYEQVSPPDVEPGSDMATNGFLPTDKPTSTASTIKHKVRRSWDWLSGSGSGSGSGP